MINRVLIEKSVYPQRRTNTFANSGDYELNPLADQERAAKLTQAAVLLILVEREGQYSVLFTRRTEHLHHHPGQICFPGGRYEQGDISLAETALRETSEEIGIDAQQFEIIGFLENYETMSGFLITPVVAFLRPPFQLQLDSFEVAEAFEVPLTFFLNPQHQQQASREFRGQLRFYYQFEYDKRLIWGATAGILMSFYRRLQALLDNNELFNAQEAKNTNLHYVV